MNHNVADQIKKEDHRALGKFIIIIIASLLIGGAFGLSISIFKSSLAKLSPNGILHFLFLISPYAIITITAVVTLVNFILYRRSKTIYNNYSDDDEVVIEHADVLLSYALWFGMLRLILVYFFFAVGIGDEILDSFQVFRFLLLMGGFIVTLFVFVIEQQKIVNLIKARNPEKRGSTFETKFIKKWEESCDEAEKLTIYKCSYKAYRSVNMTCLILWVACTFGSFIWDIGILPVTVVSLIWMIQVSSYCLESIRLSKNPSEIHS